MTPRPAAPAWGASLAWAAIALVILSDPNGANGQEANFWETALDPNLESCAFTERAAERLLRGEADHGLLMLAQETVAEALERCPEEPRLWLVQARISYELGHYERAAALLSAFIEGHPGSPFAAEATFDLGVALTRLGRFEAAGHAYEAFLDEVLWPTRRAMALTNLAEAIMARGELQAALHRFREAVAADPSYTLAYFGLAVVLDRLGEQSRALEVMRTGLSIGLGGAELHDPNVFYVPDWEIHYYRALAAEAGGDLEEARREWQSFLDGGGAGGPYAAIVQAHLRRLETTSSRHRDRD